MRKNIYLLAIVLLLSVVLIPLGIVVWLTTFLFDKKGVVIFAYASLWAYCIVHLNPFWRVEVKGLENIDRKQNYVVMSNHQDLLDIPLLYDLHVHFKWVAKREVLYMPIVGWVLWMQRGITIKRGDPNSAKKMLNEGVNFLNNGLSMIIFPEGTRTKTGHVNNFMPGAFLMAVKAQKPILPVVIDGGFGDLLKGKYRRVFRISVLPPISTEEIASTKVSLMSQRLNTIIKEEHQKIAPQRYVE